MKKTLSILVLIVMLTLTLASTVNAATNAELSSKLYALGSKYGMTSADKVKIDRYLADHPATEEQADQIIAKAEEAVKIMENAGTTSIGELTNEQKDKLKTLANEAASILGLTLVFKTGAVEIYKDGTLIETITAATANGQLAYTGNNVNAILVVSSIAVLALATVFVAKRKMANA